MTDDPDGKPVVRRWLASRAGVVTAAFLAATAFLVASGHGAHLLGALPYALLLACPLLHVFLHRGHGHHAPQGHGRDDRPEGPR
jgi:hypothetical protein